MAQKNRIIKTASTLTAYQKGKFNGGVNRGNHLADRDRTITALNNGCPYLLTGIVRNFYHIILLPKNMAISELNYLARRQMLANRLPTYLVLSNLSSVYLSPTSDDIVVRTPPSLGILVTDKLWLSQDIPDSAELRLRKEQLNTFINEKKFSGIVFGDFTKGGRTPTVEEYALLCGATEQGIPKGLEICPICSCFKGVCLDPSKENGGKIVRAHCRCENWNRCARCGQTLSEWRLNSNYYDSKDHTIWHVPGFCGLSHKCGMPALNKTKGL